MNDDDRRAEQRATLDEDLLPRLAALIAALQDLQKAGPSTREMALGITKLEEGRLWLTEHRATNLAE